MNTTKTAFSISIVFIICSIFLHPIQGQDCNPSFQLPGQCCADAILSCYDNICFQTTTEPPCPGTESPSFCGNNTIINNPQYFSLIITDFPVTIFVNVLDCSQGGVGLQMGTTTACPMDSGMNMIDCVGTAAFNWFSTIEASDGFNIGDEIFLVIDGFSGAVCEYTLDITNVLGFDLTGNNPNLTGQLVDSDIQIIDSTDLCIGRDDIWFSVFLNNVPMANQLSWVFSWAPNDTIVSDASGFSYDIPNDIAAGTYEVCVMAFSACDSSPFTCTSIDVIQIPSQVGTEIIQCGFEDILLENPTEGPNLIFSNPYTVDTIVRMEDTLGCAFDVDFDIVILDPLYELTIDTIRCDLASACAVYNILPSEDAPYTFLWEDGSTDSTQCELGAGTYAVSITGASGCVHLSEFVIVANDSLQMVINTTNESIPGAANGSATPIIEGGQTPFNYSWSNGASDSALYDLVDGTYSLTITDHFGCTAIDSFTIGTGCPYILTMNNDGIICGDPTLGSTSVDIFPDPTNTISYLWSNGSINNSLTSVPLGTYCVSITIADECTVSSCIEINNPNGLIVSETVVTDAPGSLPQGSIEIDIEGGFPFLPPSEPYIVKWFSPSGFLLHVSEDLIDVVPGDYIYVIADSIGCRISDTIRIKNLSSNENLSEAEIEVYPNPIHNSITISQSNPDQKIHTLRLLNLEGKLIDEKKISARTSMRYIWQQNDLPTGMYILQIATDKKTYIEKIIKP